MLAPHRLFNAILDVVEGKTGQGITQHLIDSLNIIVNRMVDVYVAETGYARPEFEIAFYPEQEHSLSIEGKNSYAIRIIEEYMTYIEGTPDDTSST